MDKKEDIARIDEAQKNVGIGTGSGAESMQNAPAPSAERSAGQGETGINTRAPAAGVTGGRPGQTAAPETEESRRLRENFWPIAPWAFAYSLLYVFCMYRNGSGITFPFFVAGSLLFFCSSFTKLGITLKKGSCFYMIAMLLLGISTFCTDDSFLIFFNKLGIFLLLMSLLLKQFYDTARWRLGKYLGSICILVFGSVAELGRPVVDGKAYNRGREKKVDRRVWYFAVGLLIGIPLLFVVVALLASADAVFRQMTDRLLRNISLRGILGVCLRISLLFFGAYALTACLCKRKIREPEANAPKGEPVLAITVTGLLTLTYLLFSGIQIGGLFLGKLRLPQGYTYAMYAREGFFQLLAVSLLNLVIVLFCMGYFRESKVLKGVLTVMSLCTFVMIASSAMRMVMYIRCYYLTYLRILVLWGLAVLALLFAGVVAHILKENFPLFRYHMTVVAVLYLALSFARPDYLIAKVNVANASWEKEDGGIDMTYTSYKGAKDDTYASDRNSGQEGFFLAERPYEDYAYLRGLSADAAPALVPYLQALDYDLEAFDAEDAVEYAAEQGLLEAGGSSPRSGKLGFGYYWMRGIHRRTENFGIRTYNVSRHRALEILRR